MQNDYRAWSIQLSGVPNLALEFSENGSMFHQLKRSHTVNGERDCCEAKKSTGRIVILPGKLVRPAQTNRHFRKFQPQSRFCVGNAALERVKCMKDKERGHQAESQTDVKQGQFVLCMYKPCTCLCCECFYVLCCGIVLYRRTDMIRIVLCVSIYHVRIRR